MKRTGLYIVILLVLAGAAGYFYWKDSQRSKTPADKDFAVQNIDKLEKIFLADKMGREATLTREDDHWVVNGKYPVMPAKIDILLNSLQSLQVYMPISEAAWDNVIKDLAVKHIKVELFNDKDGSPYKVFFIGTTAHNDYGNYMLMRIDGKNAERPYVVSLPGFVGDLQVRFILEEKDWRDTKVFDYALDDIKKVQVDYLNYPNESFTIEVLGSDSFKLSPAPGLDSDPLAGKQVYKPGVVKYLNSFQKLNTEAFENDFVYKDSILSTPPMAIIQVTDKNGETNKLTLYPMAANRRTKTQFDRGGNEIKFDPDRYYGLFNNDKDFGLIQQFVFGKILRRRADFYEIEKKKPEA